MTLLLAKPRSKRCFRDYALSQPQRCPAAAHIPNQTLRKPSIPGVLVGDPGRRPGRAALTCRSPEPDRLAGDDDARHDTGLVLWIAPRVEAATRVPGRQQ